VPRQLDCGECSRRKLSGRFGDAKLEHAGFSGSEPIARQAPGAYSITFGTR
jgi:hypothetical protein